MRKKILLIGLTISYFSSFANGGALKNSVVEKGKTIAANAKQTISSAVSAPRLAGITFSAPTEVVSGQAFTITASGESNDAFVVYSSLQQFPDPPNQTDPANVSVFIDNIQQVGSGYSTTGQASSFSTKIQSTLSIPVKVTFNVRYSVGSKTNSSLTTVNSLITVTVKPNVTTPPVTQPGATKITFFETDRVILGSIDNDRAGQFFNLSSRKPRIDGVDNDQVRGIQFDYVRAGAVITVYDNSAGDGRSDDWTVITVKRLVPSFHVYSFERSYEDENVKVDYKTRGNLDGKVSAIRIN